MAAFLAVCWWGMWLLIAVAALVGGAHWLDRFGGPVNSGFCGEQV